MDIPPTRTKSGRDSFSERGSSALQTGPLKFICHSRRAVDIGLQYGWLAGARYTNLRDTRHCFAPKFLDIDWKNYDFDRHLDAAKHARPMLTIARDVEAADELCDVIDEAFLLLEVAQNVAIVPKDPLLASHMERTVPKNFLFAYSVPTRYGGTKIPTRYFRRPVHLLGGRPDAQRRLAEDMQVVSLDCNRFTYDAGFGDYFDGETFRPHPEGGYDTCLRASFSKINMLWRSYQTNLPAAVFHRQSETLGDV